MSNWPVREAAEPYRAADADLVVVVGCNYDAGSSRDWAAKAPALLGVRAVLAVSFDRIHRRNLIAMGVLPLTYKPVAWSHLMPLHPTDEFDIALPQALLVGTSLINVALRRESRVYDLPAAVHVESHAELDYLNNSVLLPYMARRLSPSSAH